MTASLLAGCMLIAYGPSAVLLLAYASRRSALLILTVASAFVYLLSLFLTSLIWIAIVPWREVHPFSLIVGILIQEAARYGLIWVYIKSERAVNSLMARRRTTTGARGQQARLFNDLSAGIAAGLGFGGMQTVMLYGGVLAASGSESSFFLDSCPSIQLFPYTAGLALASNILQCALMIIALEGWRRRDWKLQAITVTLHLLFGLSTLLMQAGSSGQACAAVLPLLYVILGASVVVVARLERSPDYFAKAQQRIQ